ncbi:MAG: hypothetical protein WCK00_01825 [Deltaproteobacteria bacterium]
MSDPSPLREILEVYKELTNKYEALLGKTYDISSQLNVKVQTLPSALEVTNIVTASKISLEGTIGGITKSAEDAETASNSAKSSADKLTIKFKNLIWIMVIGYFMGIAALGYVRFAIGELSRAEIKAINSKPHTDVLDSHGNMVEIPAKGK